MTTARMVLAELVKALRAHLALAEIALERDDSELAIEELGRVRDRLQDAVTELER